MNRARPATSIRWAAATIAAGDYENAVKYERQAVAKVEYMQVMQRQLALFEKALAEKKAADRRRHESKKSN